MVVLDKTRPSILIIHENPKIARFFEGVLRNGFRTQVFMSCQEALSVIANELPDLVLCDVNCLARHINQLCNMSSEVSNSNMTLPIIVIGDRPDQNMDLVKSEIEVMDCVSESINPRLLVWKVKNWLRLNQNIIQLQNLEVCAREEVSRLRAQMANLTHDLKSSMISIRGFVRRLKKLLLSESVDSKIQSTVRCLDDAGQTVESMLEEFASVGDASQTEPLHMDEVVYEVIRQYQHLADKKGIKLQVNVTSPFSMVKAGKCQVKQILDNLVTNAIKHMGSTLRPQISVSILQSGEYVVTHISDNGMGIPEEYHDEVFNRYFRVPGQGDKAGSGLGLSIVKELVEHYGGRIWLESEPGRGTTFSFSLPQFVSTEHEFESEMVI